MVMIGDKEMTAGEPWRRCFLLPWLSPEKGLGDVLNPMRMLYF